LVITKPRSGARPAGRCQPGLGRTGAAGQGQGPARATGVVSAGVRCGATRAAPIGAGRCGLGQGDSVKRLGGGGGVHGSDAREREAGERKVKPG
jgi:hypothetical protein